MGANSNTMAVPGFSIKPWHVIGITNNLNFVDSYGEVKWQIGICYLFLWLISC